MFIRWTWNEIDENRELQKNVSIFLNLKVTFNQSDLIEFKVVNWGKRAKFLIFFLTLGLKILRL